MVTPRRLEAAGTFDKAEIARGTGSYEEPLAIDAKLRQQLPLIDKRRAGWSKLFAILTPLGFAAVIAVMVLPKLGIAADCRNSRAATPQRSSAAWAPR